ncbi:alpha/beta hydrolase [Rhodopseudomonas sp. HC1]|uniref:alpha/beta fold hydrolase n=1 Tax=Rhodopseudomonas infernalis TaxID=2897386 RepID=UPI001EE99701|nr:alpha/beta hydrolase [Rhodopseudomonas infernalis]MCG6203570.1 alpha/beta hydrolase [Rhodopseudomonas infernalis]
MSVPLFRGRAALRASPSAPIIVSTARGLVELIDRGDGPAVLALHGGMGGCDQSSLLARAALGDDPPNRVLALSRPGYLGTPQASGTTPATQADLYAALLDALRLDTAIVIAVSAGGPSALQFALRHPARCAGVVLVSCCTGTLDVPEQVRTRLPTMRWIARLPGLVALMRWSAARDPDKAASRSIRDPALRARTLADPVAGPMLCELQASVFTRMAERLPGTLTDTAYLSAMDAIDVSAVSTPLLAIHGTADTIVPFAHATRVANEAPHSKLMTIEAGEHVSLFTHLAEVRRRVSDFL